MKSSPPLIVLALAAGLWTAAACAQPAVPGSAASAAVAASATALPWIDGEVRHVDAAQGKVTLRHGDITNLGMPGMTMTFKAAEPGLLDEFKPGDKVSFTADRVNGTLTVTAIRAAR